MHKHAFDSDFRLDSPKHKRIKEDEHGTEEGSVKRNYRFEYDLQGLIDPDKILENCKKEFPEDYEYIKSVVYERLPKGIRVFLMKSDWFRSCFFTCIITRNLG